MRGEDTPLVEEIPKQFLFSNRKPLVPNSHGTVVASYPSNVYCGQFSFGAVLLAYTSGYMLMHTYICRFIILLCLL